ncbi:MAG: hypothetical protein HWD59_05310 [Coxiellaceae bacterium]|nr:MAG: hypothetical protein HWD59_05310 [Coxiellaceae bacterium]
MRTSLVITEVVKEKSLNALGLFLQQNPKQTDKLFLLSLNDLSFFQAVVRNEQDKLRAGDIFPSYRHLIDFYWLLIEFVNKQSTSQIKELQVLMQQSIVKNKLPSEADMLLAKQFIRSGVIKLAQGNELLVEALRNLGDFLEKGHAFFHHLRIYVFPMWLVERCLHRPIKSKKCFHKWPCQESCLMTIMLFYVKNFGLKMRHWP